jgi:hypothetical protein
VIAADGLKGFATQGVLPEMMRATYMRVLKFFLFPITHKSMFGTPENKGSPFTKAIAAGVASLPEGFTIQPLEVAKICLQLVCNSASPRMPAVHGSLLRVLALDPWLPTSIYRLVFIDAGGATVRERRNGGRVGATGE